MVIDADARWVSSLNGPGLAVVLSSSILGGVSSIIVILRFYLRYKERSFGWDDSLIAIGLVLFLVNVALACVGAYRGIGTNNTDLNAFLKVQSIGYFVVGMMVYFHALLFIKCSVCTTLYRIANPNKVYRIAIWSLFAIVIANYLTTFIGVLTLCHPLSGRPGAKTYREGSFVCSGLDAMIGLLYTSTACSIATDLACAVLPGIVLWRTEAKMKTKIWGTLLLSVSSLASITTVIRIPYIKCYYNPSDNLAAHVANIVLWSNVESAVGIIAGSTPSLRRFIWNKVKQSSGKKQPPLALVTLRTLPLPRRIPRSLAVITPITERCLSVATSHALGDSDWRRLKDESDHEESDGGIKAEYPFVVESPHSPSSPSLKSEV
ncbi:hypothetical protein PFICI_09796 [Pestalotiopsis fici W106-1]|uniref:Rhodopsin domain-containing protein n=1 Tax=Pestalotiopsis fici (strain W106-1 / CGMCC3.15140) TaxID=1229662 RepID=W3WV96_PESFW|nr:uncharacterized protein PFICI_09796 [Pestalotiopsis fici W106-1]ETS77734.1 hypothetical protein PFICI_09796 [Pestalotiopsis fici W106-1]